jgi:hypothetical protein
MKLPEMEKKPIYSRLSGEKTREICLLESLAGKMGGKWWEAASG